MDQQKAKIEAIYPLSPMQQGMLFHSLYAPQSGVYFVQIAITLVGKLDSQAFKQAWRQVVARHAILRTLFVWEQRKKPLQVVLKDKKAAGGVELPWTEQDWRFHKEPEQHLESYLAAQREQGFELDRAPLMRCALMQVSDERHYFVWNFHHLLLDGWSTPLLLEEVRAFYKSACRGERLFRRPPRPYKDYIVWLQRQDLAQAEAYWRQALQGFTVPTPLVVDHHTHVNDQKAYSEHKLYLSEETSAALQKMAQQNRLTINTIIQGAWALLLSRYSGEEDVLFGATVSGRPAELRGVETMVGLFINTLPVRVDVPADMPLLDWLSNLQQQQRARERYAYTPLTSIQAWSDVPPGTPLFESLFVYENYPVGKEESKKEDGLQITNVRSMEQTNYPLTFIGALAEKENQSQLYLAISYDTSRFEHHTIRRMIGHVQTLLEGIVANPYQSLAHLPLLSKAEKHHLLVESNEGPLCDYPSDKCLHQLFEQHAAAAHTSESVAVVAGGQQITYRELNARANQVAHYLIAQGVGPDVLVGICVERGIEMVVGMLGILKAGGAYLPLDPSYPQERLQFLLDDAHVKVLLTEQKVALKQQAIPQLNLDQDWPDEDQSNPVTPVRANHLAYCIYTSGSTGRPKGVTVEHRHVQALLHGFEAIAPKNKKLIGTSLCPFGFDVSVWEFFSTLCFGGTLHLLSLDILADSKRLASYIVTNQVTSLYIPPALLSDLVTELEAIHNNMQIDRILVGVEPIKQGLLQRYRNLSNDLRIINGYGPTESTVCATFFNFESALDPNRRTPIGQAVANYEVYLLDQYLRPVPIGVPGELHVGGAGVARGYLNRPQLTKEKFIPNPFRSKGQPGKLYKTGDLCRYLPDSQAPGSGPCIEFVGRSDYQVKIRGLRIELGEIEAALNSLPNVRQAVVVVLDSEMGKRLVAYIVIEDGIVSKDHVVSGAEGLRTQLRQKLPDYMIPSVFVPLEVMPLTPNGKIDRRALPAPRDAYGVDSAQQLLPRTPVERILAAIWEEVLGIKQADPEGSRRISIHDNFFEIGGHSLLVMQVVSRIRQQLNVELPLRNLFEMPTLASLAELIDALKRPKEVKESDEDENQDDRDVGEI